MKTHTTNYTDTFIEVAEDCPISYGKIPEIKGNKPTVATLQYEMIAENPYRYTSDDVLYAVFAIRKGIPKMEWEKQRQGFFSKGQPCFRASPLAKSYGWGIHSNEEGKIALYGSETAKYQQLKMDGSVKKLKALRSKKA